MNHAERVKELAQEFAGAAVVAAIVVRLGDSKPTKEQADKKAAELHAAIDAMQSALDDAVTKRDEYMGLWAALSQDEGKAERAIAELEAKLAARDAEAGRLRAALKGLEPYLDAIVCYASTMGEYEPNRLAFNARAALSEEVKGGE